MSQPTDPNNQGQPHSDLGSELRELGQQIEQAVRSALASDRAKQVQNDIASGLKEIGTQIQAAVKSIQENPRVQDLTDRGAQAVDKARESKAAHDLQEALARGIAQLNEQLAGFTQRMHTDTGTPPADTPPAGAPPTTGETTRLDIDEK